MKQDLLGIAEQGKTLLLKIAVFIIGITILILSIYWLPWQANVLAEMYPEYIYLKYPLLVGIYLTTIPFFFALYQSLKLLTFIDKNTAFSRSSVKSLNDIKCSGITIIILYGIGIITLITQDAGNPGILLIGLVIMFVTVMISLFAAILQNLLKNAIAIKSENDLTV
ncbi:DUF2975 domain-containing protein [Halalkalibacter akibai]|uniref:Putative membrane protein n=1 Tax=Halalkalibacter akibai (strain ATCC 43226 / DSM 21942 / CIP 109018 / JCM 9157 / 1139) TaxID=1236973 RepID=W4QV65_HALA3|nr:DUF2975 domain-containing protein [Halalkalibacter akibai]GAE35976.1 putative membrane protein [Halalkalibacter akibai JCM 9157]